MTGGFSNNQGQESTSSQKSDVGNQKLEDIVSYLSQKNNFLLNRLQSSPVRAARIEFLSNEDEKISSSSRKTVVEPRIFNPFHATSSCKRRQLLWLEKWCLLDHIPHKFLSEGLLFFIIQSCKLKCSKFRSFFEGKVVRNSEKSQ